MMFGWWKGKDMVAWCRT